MPHFVEWHLSVLGPSEDREHIRRTFVEDILQPCAEDDNVSVFEHPTITKATYCDLPCHGVNCERPHLFDRYTVQPDKLTVAGVSHWQAPSRLVDQLSEEFPECTLVLSTLEQSESFLSWIARAGEWSLDEVAVSVLFEPLETWAQLRKVVASGFMSGKDTHASPTFGQNMSGSTSKGC